MRIDKLCLLLLSATGSIFASSYLAAQTTPAPLSPAAVVDPFPERSKMQETTAKVSPANLPEHYIWAADASQAASIGFRTEFSLDKVPAHATLYVDGPEEITVFLDGRQIAHFEQDATATLKTTVYAVPVATLLHSGKNVLAIEAKPQQIPSCMPKEYLLLRGQFLVAKIVPAAERIDRPLSLPLTRPGACRFRPSRDGRTGRPRTHSGPRCAISTRSRETSITISGTGTQVYIAGLVMTGRTLFAASPAAGCTRSALDQGTAHFSNLDALTSGIPAEAPFSVTLLTPLSDHSAAPSLILDLGREMTGRLRVKSTSNGTARILLQYGESYEEADRKPYLGQHELTLQPSVTAYGPKSAFRYVKVQFLGGPEQMVFPVFDAEGIYYPVEHTGSFESSDSVLNRIWSVGAYTAHLCMQDSIWDAPKRDRGRWMGDLDVSGRVIETAFDDRFLMEDTLRRLNAFTPRDQAHVNTIPGYSAFWVMGLADFYRHTGEKAFLAEMAPHLNSLLDHMSQDLDERGLYKVRNGDWPFVDWSKDLAGPTMEAERATHLEYYRAFVDGAYLLKEAGLIAEANKAEAGGWTEWRAAQQLAFLRRFHKDSMAVYRLARPVLLPPLRQAPA